MYIYTYAPPLGPPKDPPGSPKVPLALPRTPNTKNTVKRPSKARKDVPEAIKPDLAMGTESVIK